MKFWGIIKNLTLTLAVCLILLYLTAYFALPYFLNKKDYSALITKNIQKQTGLVLIIKNYKLAVSPCLDITLKADGIQLFYPDKKQISDIKKAEIEFSTLRLLNKELYLSSVKADKVQFSTKLLKNGKTTFQQYLETHIKQTSSDSDFSLSQTLPKVHINEYIIKVKDEESGQKFKLEGKNFSVKQNLDFNYINLGTNGSLYCFSRKYVSYKVKFAVPKAMFKDLNKVLFDISLDNLYKQDFYANLVSDLKIHTKNDKFSYLSGKIDIDNFTMKLGAKKLPPSYFRINLDKGRAALVSEFYTNINESADINANIKLTSPYEIDMLCKCPKADIANLQKITISVLELLKIKNNLNEFTANGTVSADFKIRTDLKKLESNGNLKIKAAQLTHKNIPLKISGVNAVVDFSNNTVKIRQSDILVNNQPVNIIGTINPDATGDLLVSAKKLDLNHLMNAFPIIKPQKNLVLHSGKLSFSAKLKGKLLEASPQINAQIDNFAASQTVGAVSLSADKILLDAKTAKKDYSGNVRLLGFICRSKNIPDTTNSIVSNEISAKFDNKDLIINPSKFTTKNAKLVVSGSVKDYLKAPETLITASGTTDTSLIRSLLPKTSLPVYSKGYLPVKAVIKSRGNSFTADIKILANPSNYITPVHINNFKKTNTLTHILLRADENILLIEDFSMYYAQGLNSLVSEINPLKFKKALSIKGKIKDYTSSTPLIENLRIRTSDNLALSLPDLKNSKAVVNADISVNGTAQKPVIQGIVNVTELDIPQYFIKTQNAAVILNKNNIIFKTDTIKLKNTDISIEAVLAADALQTNRITFLKINSGYLDMDYMMSLMPLMAQSKYSPGIDFPYIISSGKLNIKSFKMGDLKAQNITADISSQKNLLYLNNLFATAYNGKTAGKITYNFPYSSIQAEIQGRGLDAASAAKDMMPQEQRVSGKLNFDASVTMFGTTQQQQLKTLKGRADVVIQNGHLGQLGRFEHFLYAQNLLSQRLIFASLNSAKQAISPKDTGYFTYLKGMLKFGSGYVHLNPVMTAGPQMSMYITGSINLLNNEADLQILGKISSEVSSSLGLLGTMTIKDFLDEHTKYGQTVANLFNFCNSELPEIDISRIPELHPNLRYQTKNFRVIISGDTESVKAVKSFTWVNPIGTKQKALKEKIQEAINKALPISPKTPVQTQPVAKPQEQLTPVIQSRPMQQSANPKTTPADFLDSIPDNFR